MWRSDICQLGLYGGQERLLSRWLLHFCDGFVLFECNKLRSSVYYLGGVNYVRKTYLLGNGAFIHNEMASLNREEPVHAPDPYMSRLKTDPGLFYVIGGMAIQAPDTTVKERILNPDYITEPLYIDRKVMMPTPGVQVGALYIPGPSVERTMRVVNPAFGRRQRRRAEVAKRRVENPGLRALQGMRGALDSC